MCRFALLLLVVPASATAEEALDVPGLDASDLRGDALVWEDATFFLEPWESGSGVRFVSFGAGRRAEVGRAVPVRIVDSTRRMFVEVELPDRSDCTWRRLEADKRIDGLRLFVRRDDLAPVLVKPFAAQYNDGTRIKLAPGVPVMPTTSGDYLVSAKSDKFRISIPHGSIGYLYKAGKVIEPDPPAGKVVRMDRNVNAKLGDESFVVRSNWLAPMPEKKTEVALVHWSTRCVDMVVSVQASTLRAAETSRPNRPNATTYGAGSGWKIPAGAPLSTISGREVAVASAPIAVPAPTDTTACFEAHFALVREDETYATQSRKIKLCTPASLLER